jgi:hypothetical protein
MKPSTLIATAAALAGFATGWLLKPAGEPGASETAAPEQAAGTRAVGAGKSRERDESPLVLRSRGGGGGEAKADPELATAQVAFERGFGNATERAENGRLSRLSEALGLSPEQKATMKVLLANRSDGSRLLNGAGVSPSEMMAQAAQAEQTFEKQLEKLLDPEQSAAFAALRQREKENTVEAKAQRDLADLIGQIDLSGNQRELALEALRGGSEEALAKLPAGWSLINEAASKLGGARAAVMEEMSEFMGDDSAMADTQEFHRRLSQSKRAAMERSLVRLGPILTPGQLAQYRSAMEARITLIEQVTPPKFERR